MLSTFGTADCAPSEDGEEEEEFNSSLTTFNDDEMPPVTVSSFKFADDDDTRNYIYTFLSLDSSFQESETKQIKIDLSPDFMSVNVTYPVDRQVFNPIHISKMFNKPYDQPFMKMFGESLKERFPNMNDVKTVKISHNLPLPEACYRKVHLLNVVVELLAHFGSARNSVDRFRRKMIFCSIALGTLSFRH